MNAAKPQQKENVWGNLLINVVIPSAILSYASGEKALGPTWALVAALAFPISYGIWDLIKMGKVNFFSALGIFSTFATGGMALLKLPPEYIAIKEASIPALFGLATVISLYTRYPLVRTFLYNERILRVSSVNAALDKHNTHTPFEKTLLIASWMLASSFFLSAVLNYGLAKFLLVSAPGTESYNKELGQMAAYSVFVITVPSMAVLLGALYYLIHNIKKLTHLDFEDIFNDGTESPPVTTPDP